MCFHAGGNNPFSSAPNGAQLIELRQQGHDRFSVRYGPQLRIGLTYSDAATELGAAIMHNAACNGELDNLEKGER